MIGWTPPKVTKYLTAAGLEALYPRFFELLREPADPPMDYGYHAGKAVRAAEKAGTIAPLLATLEKLLKNKTRFEGSEALTKLGIQKTAKPRAKAEVDDLAATPTVAPLEAIESDAIFDEQDNPVGAVEVLADHVPRLKLPLGIADMLPEQKAYLKGRYIEEIERYFG